MVGACVVVVDGDVDVVVVVVVRLCWLAEARFFGCLVVEVGSNIQSSTTNGPWDGGEVLGCSVTAVWTCSSGTTDEGVAGYPAALNAPGYAEYSSWNLCTRIPTSSTRLASGAEATARPIALNISSR